MAGGGALMLDNLMPGVTDGELESHAGEATDLITVGELKRFLDGFDDDAPLDISLTDTTGLEIWEMWRHDGTAQITLKEKN
jgi:hypothetical protein